MVEAVQLKSDQYYQGLADWAKEMGYPLSNSNQTKLWNTAKDDRRRKHRSNRCKKKAAARALQKAVNQQLMQQDEQLNNLRGLAPDEAIQLAEKEF